MFVSMEVITMIGSVVTIIIAMFSCFGWFLNRMDARIAQLDAKFEARIDGLDAKFEARIDAQDVKLGARFDRVDDRVSAVEHELTEVKVAIARLEGPPRHLIPVR